LHKRQFSHNNLPCALHNISYIFIAGWDSQTLIMNSFKAVLFAIASCSVVTIQAACAVATENESAHVKRDPQSATNAYPLASDEIVGYRGCIFGVAADAHERAFLNQTGLPH
jgi:hypothetical protein